MHRPRTGAVLPIGVRQQPQAQTGHPAFTALQQIIQTVRRHLHILAFNQFAAFAFGQAQVLLSQLQQLLRQAQARQMPIRPLTAGHQQVYADGQMIEKELQTAVQHGALGQVVVIQHHQHRGTRIELLCHLVEHPVQPLFIGKRLMALTYFQQAHGLITQTGKELAQTVQQSFKEAPWITVPAAQAQPQAAPVGRQLLTELAGQGAFAKTGRRGEQQQSALQALVKTRIQARPGHIARGQWRTEKTSIRPLIRSNFSGF